MTKPGKTRILLHKISILAHHMKTGVIAIVSSQLEKLIKVLVFFIVVEEAGERAKGHWKNIYVQGSKTGKQQKPGYSCSKS